MKLTNQRLAAMREEFTYGRYDKELVLLEAVEKLRAAIEYACGPTRDVKEPKMRAVLLEVFGPSEGGA